ncbi:MAG: adenylate/guanylate cyclase domain-containing protein [Treponema sp.]|nr:adenylate/guanylate cyclase domain-containing protein [Treponema sp.]
MKQGFREKNAPLGRGLFFALVFILVSLGAVLSGLGKKGDVFLYDLLVNLRVKQGKVKMNPLIVPIDLNDWTEAELKDAIDSRKLFTDLLTVLSDYNALTVMDFLFSYPKPEDPAFAEAIGFSRGVVLAAQAMEQNNPLFLYPELNAEERALLYANLWRFPVHGTDEVPRASAWRMPVSVLASAETVTLAHVNVLPDTDGIFRRSPLLYRWEDGFIPSLSLAAAVRQLGVDPGRIEFFPGKELVLPLSPPDEAVQEYVRIPVDIHGYMLIPYFKSWADSTDRISMNRIVKALEDDEVYEKYSQALIDHVAVAAEITITQKDLGTTSFEGLYPLSGIHTTILSGILSAAGGAKDAFLAPSGLFFKGAAFILLLAAVFFAVTGGTFLKGRQDHTAGDAAFHLRFLGVLILFSGTVLFRWRFFSASPWYFSCALGIFLTWVAAFGSRLFSRYHEQALLKNALSRYFPRSLADRIMEEGKTELIPEYKELTILFSDIAGFTKWSSDKSPETVHAFLSDYLESMAEIVFTHGGTVDKFMGDGMLCFFGDPFELPDHPRHCVEAAIAMQGKIRELAVKWKPLADIDLKVRMGINTGKVVVGNLGTRSRIEYTVIGAAVNLAQRMESNASPGAVLLARGAWEQVKDHFPDAEKRLVTVKGYEEKIEAYEIKG